MPVVRLLDICDGPLSVDAVLAAVADPAAGGIALFVGTVRDVADGRPVTGLRYEAHPNAATVMSRVAQDIAQACEPIALAAVHRVGALGVGDLAVVVAVACPHRAEAFTAAKRLIDDIKEQVPIWKHETFVDGGTAWVGVDGT